MLEIRQDLLPENSSGDLEIVQLTFGDIPSSHVYMEAQIFTPDSNRFILHESALPHFPGVSDRDPRHRYMLCDIENDCALSPITHEIGAKAPSFSPDGKYLYYFVDETEVGGGRLTLKRVALDGSDRETLLVLDTPPLGSQNSPSKIYPLSSMRSDGGKLALSCFLGDGKTENADWGLMIFDLSTLSVEVVLSGVSWSNIHPQYSRSGDDKRKCDILVQENHGSAHTARGETLSLTGGNGADIHVIKDDGTDFRDLPWGRDGHEFCQGHQCWRGTSDWALTSTRTKPAAFERLIESEVEPHTGHLGLCAPEGIRNDLSVIFPSPCFYHFATDRTGDHLVTDAYSVAKGVEIHFSDFGEPGKDPLSSWRCLARTNSTWTRDAHPHPFLSPDGTKAFFNSDESGVLQAYMIRGLEAL